MRAWMVFLAGGAALLASVPAGAYYVEASRSAIVREEADADADPLLRLERGEQLNAVTGDQTNWFYHVFLPDGETGWVSRYVVRLYEGTAPEGAPVAVMPDVGGGLTSREREYAAFHLAVGKPKGYREIIREGYTLGYDPRLKIPAWVQYRLTAEHSSDNAYPRTDSFDEDALLAPQARAILDDYEGLAGAYVRGHMAPAEDMRWSETAESESNLLSNIAPQIGSAFNGSVWKTLENRVRGWVMDRQDLTIICGPVFTTRSEVDTVYRQPETERQTLYNVIGESGIAVPTAFYKVVVDMRDLGHPNVLAFLVPHIETINGPERDLDTYLTSVDRIERLTGLDFLAALPDNVQAAVESVTVAETW